MQTRLRTSKESKELLNTLNSLLRMSNNAIILRYAMIRSIQATKPIENDTDAVVNNNAGFEISRSTLFGDNEIIYKALMNALEIDDESFFPKLVNKHIERGLKIMNRDYKLAGNKEKFIKNYIKKIEEGFVKKTV